MFTLRPTLHAAGERKRSCFRHAAPGTGNFGGGVCTKLGFEPWITAHSSPEPAIRALGFLRTIWGQPQNRHCQRWRSCPGQIAKWASWAL